MAIGMQLPVRPQRRRHHTIDAPAHRDHKKNMITGASQAANHILVPDGNSSAMAKRVRTEMRRKFDRPESAQDSIHLATWARIASRARIAEHAWCSVPPALETVRSSDIGGHSKMIWQRSSLMNLASSRTACAARKQNAPITATTERNTHTHIN